MKKLIIIRHGKATQELMPDKKRHLIKKGIKRTEKTVRSLIEFGIVPDLIISSPAMRAYQTAEIVAKAYRYPENKIEINKHFYFYPDEIIMNQIYALPQTIETAFIFGHNPSWTDIADEFAHMDIWHLPTSGAFGVSFDTNNWTEIESATKKDLFFIDPRTDAKN